MYALTVKQPWSEAIARYGKTVENRSRRPPAHLLGQRIAIHVSQTWPGDRSLWALPFLRSETDLAIWVREQLAKDSKTHKAPPPDAGRIIATARLVGWWRRDVDLTSGNRGIAWDHVSGQREKLPVDSPWATGPVCWALSERRALREPVHGGVELQFEGCRPDCYSEGCPMCDGRTTVVTVKPIRGQVYPFALSPEVESAVLATEVEL